MNYYFSMSGDDSRSSSKSIATPWRTLAKLNSFFNSLLPGDSVLLKRGDTFYGTILVQKSGTDSSKITIGAYGVGANPIINSPDNFIILSGNKNIIINGIDFEV